MSQPLNNTAEEELIRRCSPSPKHEHVTSWTAEYYGFGKHLRRYGYYPSFLPLCIATDHGPAQQDEPLKSELTTALPIMFYHSPRLVKRFKELSSKPCYPLYSPFVFYRRSNDINPVGTAQGTIAFPSHSTPDIDDASDIEKYIVSLKQLPQKFQPVSVCLYFHDITAKKLHPVFQKHGIPVFTAGHPSHPDFTENFYSIIRNFRYGTSNSAGSYLFYCIEMGIPFFLHGPEPLLVNKTDRNLAAGIYDAKKEYVHYNRVLGLFSAMTDSISAEQLDLVEDELGMRSGVSRMKFCSLLYSSFARYYFWWIMRKFNPRNV